MFGLEFLDVAIGLMLVYLLLSLFATALNEYIAAVFNLRGKELAKGLGQLLDDIDEGDALQSAWNGVGTKLTTTTASLTEQLYNHRLIRPFATRQGWMTRFWRWLRGKQGNPRLPSYIPARTFALALLDVLGVDEKDASLERLVPAAGSPSPAVKAAEQALADAQRAQAAPGANTEEAARRVAAARATLAREKLAQAVAAAEQAVAQAQAAHAAAPKANRDQAAQAVAAARQALAKVQIARVLAVLKQESSLDLTERLSTLGGLGTTGSQLAADLQVQVAGLVADAQTQLQKLQDGVEVWFNNAMDRVSGAYKRTAQGWLFVLGLLIASCMNADTIDIWRRLEADDELRAAMVRRAEATVAAQDTTLATAVRDSVVRANRPADTTANSTADTTANRAAAGNTSTVAVSADTTTKPDSTSAVKQARENYLAARARVDSMELELGWTQEEAVRVGLLRKDRPRGAPARTAPVTRLDAAQAQPQGWVPDGYHADLLFPFKSQAGFLKLIGLLLTGLAVSLGAPFWFDLLNKVISIRAAGRSPEERPKSPEGGPKRIAERAPK